MAKVNIAGKFELIKEYWQPKIVAELNDSYVKLAKLKGDFVWHHHDTEDELFMIVKGNLTIRLKDGEINLGPGELVVIPRGVEHMPVAKEEVHLLLLEPKSTVNTGNIENEHTVLAEWI